MCSVIPVDSCYDSFVIQGGRRKKHPYTTTDFLVAKWEANRSHELGDRESPVSWQV